MRVAKRNIGYRNSATADILTRLRNRDGSSVNAEPPIRPRALIHNCEPLINAQPQADIFKSPQFAALRALAIADMQRCCIGFTDGQSCAHR